MSLKYRIILRKNMTKGAAEGSKLYYGQVRSLDKTPFKKLCSMVSDYCTAKKGEVELVVDGLINVMKNLLDGGNVIQMGDFGNFRMIAGSKGTAVKKDFDVMLFKKGRIVFTPGKILKDITEKPTFVNLEDNKETAGSGTGSGTGGSGSETGGGSGGDEKPGGL
jgi:predicted histone-like DNA-binding protein